MHNILKNNIALSTVVTTLIILVVSVLLAGIVTEFGVNVISVQMQQESLQIERFHVWASAESNPAEAAFFVVNQGGRDVTFNKIAVRGQVVSSDKVSYAVTDKPVTEDLEYIQSLDTGGRIVTIDELSGDNITLNQAIGSLMLPSGKSMLVYIYKPGSVTLNDIGLTVSVAVFTSMTLYYKETNVEAYVTSILVQPSQNNQNSISPVQLSLSPTPPVGQIYWNAKFEYGNFDEITSNSGGEVQSDYGTSSILESTNVFSGVYSVKNSINTPPSSGVTHTKLVRWGVVKDTPQYYFGAALYIPPSFTVSTASGANWCNIMQLHCKSDSALGLPACIILSNYDGTIKMSLYQKDYSGNEHTYWTSNAPIGQWFRVVLYAEFEQNGHLAMWLSTARSGQLTDSDLVYSGVVDLRTGDNFAGAFIDTGIYQDYRSPAQYILSDSMTVASALDAATPEG
jgi:hypothetical protein